MEISQNTDNNDDTADISSNDGKTNIKKYGFDCDIIKDKRVDPDTNIILDVEL